MLSPAFADTPAWVLYTHPDKLMSIRFPSKPSESEQEAPSPIGKIKFKLAAVSDNTHAYLATAVIYPTKEKFDVKAALAGGRDQALANVKGKATGEKQVKLDGFDGLDVQFDAQGPNNQPIHGTLRIFASAKPPAAYMATSLRMTDAPDPNAQKFFDSMHLGKKVETK